MKTHCRFCGAAILEQTAQKTVGYCMPCFSKKWYGRLLNRLFPKLFARQKRLGLESRDESKFLLGEAKASMAWQLPAAFLERDWSNAKLPVELFPREHLALMLRIEQSALTLGASSDRVNVGAARFGRVLRLRGGRLLLVAGASGTILRSTTFLPSFLSKAGRRGEAVMRELLARCKG